MTENQSYILRIKKDYSSLQEDLPGWVREIDLIDDDITKWRVVIKCLDHAGPFRDAILAIDLIFGIDYPYKQPVVKFTHQIFHPNIDFTTGVLCTDGKWAVIYDVEMLLFTIRNLLTYPSISIDGSENPVNIEAAALYSNEPETYSEICRKLLEKNTLYNLNTAGAFEIYQKVPEKNILKSPFKINPPKGFRTSSNRPVIASSLKLIENYREINRSYYAGPSRHVVFKDGCDNENHNYDDENHNYIIRSEELLDNRYVLKERIGLGSFGQVVSAFDKKENTMVAIKIIKSKKPFFNQAQTEKELLMHISKSRGNNDYNLVELYDHFVFKNHQCLVFEMLSFNLYDLLKNTRFKGVSLNLIRKFSRQILMSLDFLSKSDIDIIHCDLKPENILLRHPRRSALKLIDFGSSCFSNKKMYTYIQSRF